MAMAESIPPDASRPPPSRPPMPCPDRGKGPPDHPPRPSLAQRLLPWVELLYKLLAALAAALALWKGLG